MSDYARTQELVGEAYNATGAAEQQFEKTQDSLQSKLALLKNAWNEFLMGITNNSFVKGAVDILTAILNGVNKLTSGFGETTNSVLKLTTAIFQVVYQVLPHKLALVLVGQFKLFLQLYQVKYQVVLVVR